MFMQMSYVTNPNIHVSYLPGKSYLKTKANKNDLLQSGIVAFTPVIILNGGKGGMGCHFSSSVIKKKIP